MLGDEAPVRESDSLQQCQARGGLVLPTEVLQDDV